MIGRAKEIAAVLAIPEEDFKASMENGIARANSSAGARSGSGSGC